MRKVFLFRELTFVTFIFQFSNKYIKTSHLLVVRDKTIQAQKIQTTASELLPLGHPPSDVVIKFPYNAHSDWLKQRSLSENRERVDDGKLAFKFLLRNFDKFDPN